MRYSDWERTHWQLLVDMYRETEKNDNETTEFKVHGGLFFCRSRVLD